MQQQQSFINDPNKNPQNYLQPQNNTSQGPVNIFNQPPQTPVNLPQQTQPPQITQPENSSSISDPGLITITQNHENPMDSIQMIKWMPEQDNHPSKNCFAAVGWDGCVRVYSIETVAPNQEILKQEANVFFGEPVQCLEWMHIANGLFPTMLFVGLIGGSVKSLNLIDKSIIEIYKGTIPPLNIFQVSKGDIKYLLYVSMGNCIKLLKLNLGRNFNANSQEYIIQTREFSFRDNQLITTVDYKNDMIILGVAMATSQNSQNFRDTTPTQNVDNRNFVCYGRVDDFFCEKPNPYMQYKEFMNKGSFTSCSISNINPKEFVMGTNYSRILTYELTEDSVGRLIGVEGNYGKHYEANFTVDGNKFVTKFPISQVEMVNNNTTKGKIIASGGGDGKLVLTNFGLRKCASKFRQRDKVTCGKLSKCGKYLAYAIGDDWSMGVHGMYEYYEGVRIFVRKFSGEDFKVKP